jgi:DNA polymerase (family X)
VEAIPTGQRPIRSAADSLAALAVPLHVLIAEDRLTEIPGVGDAIADIVTKLHKTGTHPSLEKLRKEIPEAVLEMLAVPGLRPEKVLRLYEDLGITSLAELEAAAKDDRIKKAKGLGAALQTKILQNLAIAKSGEGRLHLHRAAALLEHAKDSIRKERPELKRLTIAGDFRRGCELVGDLTIVAEAAKADKTPKASAADGLQIRLSDRKHFGAALLFATGSAAHIEKLQDLAAEKGMRLETDGLHKGRTLIAGDEAGIYRALGLPFIDPELREGRGEVELALKGKLPKLVPTTTCAESFTATRTPPMAPRPWKGWRKQLANAVSNISGSRTIPSRRTTQAVSPWRRSRSSTAKPTD